MSFAERYLMDTKELEAMEERIGLCTNQEWNRKHPRLVFGLRIVLVVMVGIVFFSVFLLN